MAAVFCFVAVALCLQVPAVWSQQQVASQREGMMAITRVVEVPAADVVVLGAGRLDGLAADAQVMLLREADPIVHPLTGEVLGTPQEPVGTVSIFELQDHSARARLVKAYSIPAVDDLAEFEKSAAEDRWLEIELKQERIERTKTGGID